MLVNRQQEWLDYPYQEPTNPPAKATAPRPDSSTRRQCLQLIFLVVAMAMLITVHSEAIVRAGYDLVEMKAQAAKLERENEAMKLEIAKLKSPQRIQQIATRELGMVMPQNAYYATSTAKSAGQTPAIADKGGAVVSLLKLNKAEASTGR